MISLAALRELISTSRLTDTLIGLVNIPSATGEETALASHIVDCLAAAGISAELQPLDADQANALGQLSGSHQGNRLGGHSADASGRNLLLYAPIDTVTSNSESEDLPWAGAELRPDMRAAAYTMQDHVLGLGAHNPKGHVACIIEAARVLKQLAPELAGNVYFGFGAGGMPTHAREQRREDSGHGAGCKALIAQLPPVDGAIIAKSGEAVTWEEVGFVWMEITVSGTHTYVGSRHLLPYSNAIANASKLILKLEDWFEQRASEHASDCVRPQAVISHIEAGWKRMPAFTPACCRFIADLRFGPLSSADEVEDEFRAKLVELCAELGVEASANCIQTIDASRTPQGDPIIATTIACWEAIKGRPHQPFTQMSGATDANMLRQAGIPTARVGLPKASLPDLDFQLGMNSVSIAALQELTLLLVASTLSFCAAADLGAEALANGERRRG